MPPNSTTVRSMAAVIAFAVGAVCLDCQRLYAERLHRLGNFVRAVGRTGIGECHMRTFVGETFHDRRAYSTTTTGNEGTFVFQIVVHLFQLVSIN